MRLLNAFAGFCLLMAAAMTSPVSAQCPPDTEAPVITDMPANITGTADAGLCGTNVSWDLPTATDNCEVTFFSANQVPGDFYAVGITTVTYTAMDAEGNMSASSFTITISDDEDPTIADMPGNQSANNDTDICGAVVTWTEPTADDNCGIASLTSNHDSGDTFPVGTTTVTYTATDVNGSSVSASFDVVVSDTQNPSISGMPANITATADAGACTAAVSWTAPTSSDNCAVSTFDADETSGDDFPVGTTTVTYTATDIHGNSATASFTITVTDDEDPSITQMADLSATNDATNCSAVVTWTDPAVTDNCANSTLTPDIASGTAFDVGVTTVTYTATDIHGNSSTMSFDVTVTDTEKPVIDDMPANITQAADPGVCSAAVTWDAPTATDNCTLATLSPTHSIGSSFAVGTSTVTYTAIDIYGNTETASFTITVTSGDSDSDGICDSADLCSDTNACNYADPANVACATPTGCETCSDGTGTGTIVDNDADDDGVCDADEVVGCQDNTACNYNSNATDAGSCTYTDGVCETCSGATDGTGTVVDNDADDDGVCDADEVVGCQDNTACNYNPLATDAGACTYVDGICDTCVGGVIVDNDADDDGVCDADEIVGCQDNTACNYNSNATDAGACTFTDGVCETCSGATDGTGTIVDNDSDDDGVCDADEIVGCQDNTACNYNSAATDAGACTFTDGVCETCSGATDGTGTVVDNDADDDGVCDGDEIVGCQDNTACNYNAAATDAGTCTYTDGVCETCVAGAIVDNDADDDGVCDADEIAGCQDNTACNYNSNATDDNASCVYPVGSCDTCSGATDGTGTVVDNDADDDGVCDADEVVGCQDNTACNYNSNATDAGACTYTSDPCDTCSGATDGTGTVVDNDSDDDGTCDADEIVGCQDNTACNYNAAATDAGTCTYVDGICETCVAGAIVDNDADDDGVCDADEIPGCQDSGACNYNSNATDNDASCVYPVGICDTCSGATDGTGTVVDNDADDDGVCDADEVVGCQDNTACNYNSNATDAGACTFTSDPCDTCSGATDGTGTVVDNDSDDDGVCDDNEIVGCQDNTACNYNAAATDAGTCTYTDGVCETCVAGAIVDNDADDDGVCDDNEIVGCQDNTACNYDATATDAGTCTYVDGICETCVAGAIVDNDADDDGVCDADEIPGCQDNTACNYNSNATDSDASCIYATGCETCSGQTDGTGTIVDNDADDDGVCDADEITGCTDASACNYDSTPTTDTDNTLCTYTVDACDTCSGATDGTGTVVDNDADDDDTCDDVDGCPNDPYKTAPGVCGCGNEDTDVDSDGVCDDNDLCTDPLANNYLSPGGEECEVCPDAPIFNGIAPVTPATTLSSADGAISLDLAGNEPTTLFLMGVNGAPNYTISLPDDLNDLQAGYYIATIQDADGCWGVAGTSPGGTTLQQPAISLELIIPYDLCCSGCGINDTDADGICDDDDNCTDQTAPNFADPANTDCIQP